MLTIIASRLVLAAFAAAPLMFNSAAQSQSTFDGRWSVKIVADAGECPAVGFAVPIKVSDGRISYNGMFDAVAAGKVATDGKLKVRMEHQKDVVTATGALADGSGSGRWTSPTLACKGSWVATRA
jgi:hypothetical protein